MFGNDFTEYKTIKLSIAVFPYAANTPLPHFDLTPMVAEITANCTFWKRFVEHGLFHLGLPF